MNVKWKDILKIGTGIFGIYLVLRYWPQAATLLGTLLSAATPILIGAVIAYLVNILMESYEKRYFPGTKRRWLRLTRRPVCMILAFLTLIAAVALIVLLIVPQLGDCIAVIVDGLPGFMESAVAWVIAMSQRLDMEMLTPELLQTLESIDWQSRIGELVKMVTSGLGSMVDVLISAVSSVVSGVITGLMSLIFAIYLLLSKETLLNQCRRLTDRYFPAGLNRRIRGFLAVLNDCFRRYIVGQCTEALILGLLCTVGMWALQLPYATMIGALVGFTALIPIAGAYIGAGVGAFMILTVEPFQALVFLIFIVVLQQLEGNLIYPRVVGSSLGLPGIWVLTAVTVGGGIMGIGGMLLGVPLAAAIYRVVGDDVRRRERQEMQENSEKQDEIQNKM